MTADERPRQRRRGGRFSERGAQVRRLGRFAWRAVREPGYMSHVLDVIQRQGRTTRVAGDASSQSEGVDLRGRRVYFIGGCEFTYMKELLERRGAVAFHTFDYGRTSDPRAEVADPASPLWTFDADVVILSQMQSATRLFHHAQWRGRELDRETQLAHLDELGAQYADAARTVAERIAKPVILLTHPLVYRPSLGLAEHRSLPDAYGLAELMRLHTLKVYEVARSVAATYVLDVEAALEQAGKETALNSDDELLGEHFTRRGGEVVAERLIALLGTCLPGLRRIKCAVFDLDDTLWSGIIREVGPEGVIVRRPYLRAMRYLASRGIALAICSKNDPVELELFPELVGADLDSLVAVKHATWGLKSDGLREIASSLNIGLDAIAFFDDNPRERAEVSMNAPDVLVLAETEILPALNRPEFQAFGVVTDDATQRAAFYAADQSRKSAEATSGQREDFLASLALRLTLRRPTLGDIARVAELIERTNQLNATLRRSSADEIRRAVADDDAYETVVALLDDSFGDYGLIGAVVAEKGPTSWEIVEFAFSCRAMGRDVEHAVLAHLAERARARGAESLVLEFHRTERSGELERILHAVGFADDGRSDLARDVVPMRLDLSAAAPSVPEWLTIDDAGVSAG